MNKIDYDKMLKQNDRHFYIFATFVTLMGATYIAICLIKIFGN